MDRAIKNIKCHYVANTDWALFNFRGGIIKSLQENGFQVGCICSETGFWNHLEGLNLSSTFKISKYVKQIDPIKDIQLCFEYYWLYLRIKPDMVHHFTIKPVIYGSLGAKMAGVPIIVNTITGLGYVFTDGEKIRPWQKRLVRGLYKLSSMVSDYLWFQNDQDRDYFLKKNIVQRKKSGVVFGSGVDVDFFSAKKVKMETERALRNELKLHRDTITVFMIARMLYDKGVREFIEAARRIIYKMNYVKFILVGPLAPGNPSMIPLKQINTWVEEGIIKYLGRRLDIRELIYLADIVVLPSYREGIPKSLLESAAMGKPIITTDTVGCREVVDDEENGLIVPVKNSLALQKAIEKLLLNPTLRKKMGEKSRQKAINKFDQKLVISQTLIMYKKLISQTGKYDLELNNIRNR